MVDTDVRLVWPVGAMLGEGPAWFPQEQALRFVDIKGGKLHRFVPETGERDTLDLGGMPSFVLPEADGGLIVGSRDRLLPAGAWAIGSGCDARANADA